MFETLLAFFSQAPPAFDPVFIPWLSALIAGNVIILGSIWAALRYIAKVTPWAGDDKIIQIITGVFTALKSGKDANAECVEHVANGEGICENCGHPIE